MYNYVIKSSTLSSLIDGVCGIVGVVEKISKTNSWERGGIVGRGENSRSERGGLEIIGDFNSWWEGVSF